MDVRLTPDQEAFVRQAIASGRLQHPEDAVREALSLWEERERARTELLSVIEIAERSLECGEGLAVTQDSMRVLSHDVKQRGRARLADDPKPRR